MSRSVGLVTTQVMTEAEEEAWSELPLAERVARILAEDPDLPPVTETQATTITRTQP